jgi:hypothetical protein
MVLFDYTESITIELEIVWWLKLWGTPPMKEEQYCMPLFYPIPKRMKSLWASQIISYNAEFLPHTISNFVYQFHNPILSLNYQINIPP